MIAKGKGKTDYYEETKDSGALRNFNYAGERSGFPGSYNAGDDREWWLSSGAWGDVSALCDRRTTILQGFHQYVSAFWV